MHRRTKILLYTLAALLLLYAAPFILYACVNSNDKQFMYEQLVYKQLCDSITRGAETDSAKAMLIFEYVSNHCQQPQGKQNPKYNTTYDVYQNKTAFCDQQVWLMNALLQVENIKSHMVFLYGYDSISHHTVAAVEIKRGNPSMLDPFNKLYFTDGQGRLASIGDIMKGNVRVVGTMPEGYLKLYETRYDCKYHSDNTLPGPRKKLRTVLWIYKSIFGKLFTGPFMGIH